MFVRGYFGQPYYNTLPRLVSDKMLGQVLGWRPTQRQKIQEGEAVHCIVITGALSFKEKDQKYHRVYFVDPNDDSDPKVLRKVYTMSIKTFLNYLDPFERMDDVSLNGEVNPAYGIQRNAVKKT